MHTCKLARSRGHQCEIPQGNLAAPPCKTLSLSHDPNIRDARDEVSQSRFPVLLPTCPTRSAATCVSPRCQIYNQTPPTIQPDNPLEDLPKNSFHKSYMHAFPNQMIAASTSSKLVGNNHFSCLWCVMWFFFGTDRAVAHHSPGKSRHL